MFTHWLGLFISMRVLLLVARRSLPLALVLSALLLGSFTLSPIGVWVEGEISYRGPLSVGNLLLPLSILLLAPLLDFLLAKAFVLSVREWTTLIAVSCSLGLALVLSNLSGKDLGRIGERMAPWNFTLMIIGMFLFFSIFRASGMSEFMASLAFSEPLLCLVSFLLGVVTGRTQLPTSVVIPTYLSMVGANPMPLPIFALVFFSASLGYLVSPVHPCVSVSLAYFGTDMGNYLKAMALPTLLALIPALVLTFVL